MTELTHTRWRVGRKVGRTIYLQLGGEPNDQDPIIGLMDSPELAAIVVDAVNAARAGVTIGRCGEFCPAPAPPFAECCDEHDDEDNLL